MTNARTPSSDRSGKDCLCGTYFVVLYALIAYDYPRLVIRLIRKVPMKASPATTHFKTMAMVDVPRSRNGKHKKIVTAILRNLDELGEDSAFKVPLADL